MQKPFLVNIDRQEEALTLVMRKLVCNFLLIGGHSKVSVPFVSKQQQDPALSQDLLFAKHVGTLCLLDTSWDYHCVKIFIIKRWYQK